MKLIKDLRQRHLEDFETHFNAVGPQKGRSTIAGLTVRAAIQAGWFADPVTVDAVGDMTGAEVEALSLSVDKVYMEARHIDPN